jgi:hypothetical protein
MMGEKRDQNDEWDGHAEEQQQNRPHGKSPYLESQEERLGR